MAKLVGGISAFLLVLGIVVAAYGYLALGGGEEPITSDYNPGFDPSVAGSLLALAAGALCFVTSIAGFLTAYFKKFFFALPFMILAIVIGLLMLAGAAITSGAGGYLAQMKIQACDTIAEGVTPAMSYEDKIALEYTNMVDRLMCSPWCPCPAAVESTWTAVSQDKLKEFTRQDQTRDPYTIDQCTNFAAKQFDADVIPMSFSKTTCGVENTYPIEVSNYGECYEKNLKPIFEAEAAKSDADKDPNLKKTMEYVDRFFESGGYEFIGLLEEKYNCGSMCRKPLFYLKKDVADGPPEVDCIEAVIDDLSDNMAIAILFGITGLLCLIAAAGSFPLCSGTSGKKEQEVQDGDE